MTTISNEPVTCALCGETALQCIVGSTSSFGSTDLDLRPAEPERGALFALIQRCSSCGYCAHRVDEATEWPREIVASEAYRSQLHDPAFPDLANTFLCSAMVLEDIEEAAAALNAIQAAWACDDAGAHEAARRCRLRAVQLLRESEAEGDELYEDLSIQYAVIVDLLRRAGEFDEAVQEADVALTDAGTDDEVLAILAFSRSLSVAGDSGTYVLTDAVQ